MHLAVNMLNGSESFMFLKSIFFHVWLYFGTFFPKFTHSSFPYLVWQLIVHPSLPCSALYRSIYLLQQSVRWLCLLTLTSSYHPPLSLSTCLALLLLLFLLRLSTHFLPPIIKVIATFLPLAFVCLVCLCAGGREKAGKKKAGSVAWQRCGGGGAEGREALAGVLPKRKLF